jgi:tetratricopeptide (TPR) repeat protein
LAPLLTALPLLRLPGYELSTALGLLLAFFSYLPGIATVQLARSEQGASLGLRSLGKCFLVSWASALALCVPTVFTALIVAALTTPCSPLAGLPFCVLLLPSASALVAAVGVMCAVLTRRTRGAVGWMLAFVLLSAAVTAWPIVMGPQVFAFNLFAGFFPGPIYDESVRLTEAVWWSRFEALGWTGMALSFARLVSDPVTLMPTSTRLSARRSPLAWLTLGASALVVLSLRMQAAHLGLRTTDADVAAMLGGLRETEHFRIHYPSERSRAEVERLARDLEYRYAQDSAFLGVAEDERIDAYFYRSAEEKQRWVGAANTDFAKPWLHAFHLQFEGFPDRVAKHELAHVLAGKLGAGPFEVSGGSLFPNAGLIEGLAEAADNAADELTLDQWAHAMRQLGLAPDLRSLFSAAGFWAQEQARAYTLAGSFLRFIDQTYGQKALQVLYHSGNFVGATGRSLDVLVSDWEAHVDQAPLDERALHLARLRFSGASLFQQACARETAQLRDQAVGSSDPVKALAIQERLRALEPENPGPLFAEAEIHREAGDLAAAEASLEQVLALPHSGEVARAQAQLALGDLAWAREDAAKAREHFGHVVELAPDRATTRAAEIRLHSLEDAQVAHTVQTYFRHPSREDALLNLDELARAKPELPEPSYLIGRRLLDSHLPDEALSYFRRPPPPEPNELPEVTREWRRLRVVAESERLECAAAQQDAEALLSLDGGRSSARGMPDAVFVDDWLGRCQFERQHFGKPVEE